MPNAEHRTPNAERRTPNAEHRSPNTDPRSPRPRSRPPKRRIPPASLTIECAAALPDAPIRHRRADFVADRRFIHRLSFRDSFS
ncbi:hypothetical protein C7270_19090 [Burkholderia thailandensis]|nr:hypothetical protein [Burkholderia thailandensis]PNE71844.1 hypothetical protein A8H38_06815 [Burkholderia thailandensis]